MCSIRVARKGPSCASQKRISRCLEKFGVIARRKSSAELSQSVRMAPPAGSYFGRERFDPILILAQIVLLQSCFYTSLVRLERSRASHLRDAFDVNDVQISSERAPVGRVSNPNILNRRSLRTVFENVVPMFAPLVQPGFGPG